MGHGGRRHQHCRGQPAGARRQPGVRARARATGRGRDLTAKRCLLAFLIIFGLPYACSPIYRFPDPSPFAGSAFYNPYATLAGTWQRANLHAHGAEWGGLTNGQQPSEDVAATYRGLGYDIAGISNYQSIMTFAGVDTLPLYEHGYNVSKRHQLAIGARRVEWFDFPFWQGLSHEQFVIDRVRGTTELLGLTHPGSRDAYSESDLQYLTGYQFIEIVNGPFGSQKPWDAALSSGRVVWAMANDDTHDTGDPRRTAMAWNMIDAPSAASTEIIAALRAGRTYAVGRRDDAPPGMDVHITGVECDGGAIRVTTEGALSDIEFIGQGGQSRRKIESVLSASYTFEPRDSYIRTVVHTPRTTIYLNPVLRYDGRALPVPMATTDQAMTWTMRGAALIGFIVAVTLLWPHRRNSVHTSTAPVLPETDRETA